MKPTASHFEMLPEAERVNPFLQHEERVDEDNEDWASCDEGYPQHGDPGEESDDEWDSFDEGHPQHEDQGEESEDEWALCHER